MSATKRISSEDVLLGIYQAALEDRPWLGILGLLAGFFDLSSASATVPWGEGQASCYLVSRPGGGLPRLRKYPLEGPAAGSSRTAAGPCGATRHHAMRADCLAQDGLVCRLALHRRKGQPPFTEDDRAALGVFLPHIESALELAADVARRDMERLLYEFALDQMGIGVLFLNEEGKLLHASEVVRALLDAEEGIRLINGRVEGCFAADTRNLRRLIDMARKEPEKIFGGAVSRRSDGRSIGIMTRTVPAKAGVCSKTQPAMAVFLRDTYSRTSMDSGELSQFFGFTAAEARLSVELASGRSLDEAAHALGIRRNTARAHLRSIFSKANVSRQTELVRLLIM
ncbi:MAG: helix-turn-helix transcriptional regulator [Novosphingobium sp.]|nr:helix-turn-helix transcriptional regulator [Novosphingobium sp.]